MAYVPEGARNIGISGNEQEDGLAAEHRIITDNLGRLVVIAAGGAGSYPLNPEADNDAIPAGETRETPNVLLQGYDPIGTDWERIHTDSAHRLLVSVGNWPATQPISAIALPLPAGASTSAIQATMDTSLNNIETDAAAIEVLITAGNVDLAAIEVLLTASNVDLAAIEALQITIDASLNEIEDATENLEEALQSIGTDHLLIGDAGAIINLDAAGHPQVDVITMPVVAVTGTFWQATQPVSGTFWQATQPISAVALPLPVGAATSAIQGTMDTSLNEIEDAIENLEESLASIGTDYLLIGDAGAIIHLDAAGDPQVDVLTMPVVAVTGTFWQATQPVSGTFWQATQPISAAALPLPALASTSTIQATMNTSLNNIETAIQIMDDWDSGDRCKVEIDQVDAVYNPETDDGQIPDGEVHDSVIAVLYAYNTSATDLKRVLVNNSGALMVYTP